MDINRMELYTRFRDFLSDDGIDAKFLKTDKHEIRLWLDKATGGTTPLMFRNLSMYSTCNTLFESELVSDEVRMNFIKIVLMHAKVRSEKLNGNKNDYFTLMGISKYTKNDVLTWVEELYKTIDKIEGKSQEQIVNSFSNNVDYNSNNQITFVNNVTHINGNNNNVSNNGDNNITINNDHKLRNIVSVAADFATVSASLAPIITQLQNFAG